MTKLEELRLDLEEGLAILRDMGADKARPRRHQLAFLLSCVNRARAVVATRELSERASKEALPAYERG